MRRYVPLTEWSRRWLPRRTWRAARRSRSRRSRSPYAFGHFCRRHRPPICPWSLFAAACFAHDRSIETHRPTTDPNRSRPMNAKLLPLIITLSLAAGMALAAPQSSESPAAGSATNRGKIDDGGSSGAVITGPALELYHGEVQVLDLANVTRVAVGDGGVLHANVVASNQQVILIGEGAGTTSLRVWTRNGPQFTYEVKVRSFDTAQILRDVQDLLAGEPGISARQVDGHVLIEGDYTAAKTA